MAGALEHTLSGQDSGAARHYLPRPQCRGGAGGAGRADLLQRGVACLLDFGSPARGGDRGTHTDTSVSAQIKLSWHKGVQLIAQSV